MIPAYNYTYWVSQANKHHNGELHSVQLGLSFLLPTVARGLKKPRSPKIPAIWKLIAIDPGSNSPPWHLIFGHGRDFSSARFEKRAMEHVENGWTQRGSTESKFLFAQDFQAKPCCFSFKAYVLADTVWISHHFHCRFDLLIPRGLLGGSSHES